MVPYFEQPSVRIGPLTIHPFGVILAAAVLAGLVYLDVVAFVFPIALMVGRLACTVAHDHPGAITSFPLAVSLESAEAQEYITGVYADAGRLAELPAAPALARLGFHDLGWYEFLYLAVIVVPAVLFLDRRPRRPGFFLAAFFALYLPVRFLLDFLRVADARFAGLTPAQWLALAALLVSPLIVARNRRHPASAPGRREIPPAASENEAPPVDPTQQSHAVTDQRAPATERS